MNISSLHLEPAVMLAPLAGVSSWPMRLICREFGAPLAFTEMVSAAAIARGHGGVDTQNALKNHPADRPLGIQIFGADPQEMARAAETLSALEADLIDINMGCPVRKVVKNGAGAALMRDLERAQKIARAVRRVVKVPLTVKMRLGWDNNSRNAVELARICADEGVDAVTVHGRTRAQAFAGETDLEGIREVVAAVKIPVIGNGGIMSAAGARRMMEITGCAAVMVARGARGNPWIFAAIKEGDDSPRANPTPEQKAAVVLKHFAWMREFLPPKPAVLEMRKHLAWYSRGLSRAADLRRELQKLSTREQLLELVPRYFLSLTS